MAVRRWHADDLYLACACARRLPPAIDAFERLHLSVVDTALARLGTDAETIAEIKQRLRHRVLLGGQDPARPAKILEYEGRGSLRGWLRVMAVREATQMSRALRRERALDDEALCSLVSARATPVLEEYKDRMRGEFKQAFARALAGLSDRDRIFLGQHFIDGLTIDELGRVHGIHRSTAARRLRRAELTLRARTHTEFRARIDVPSEEIDSILRLIRSRLEVSLRNLRVRRRRP